MEFHEERNYVAVATKRLQIHEGTYGWTRSSRKGFLPLRKISQKRRERRVNLASKLK
jgi:hypothetical protein